MIAFAPNRLLRAIACLLVFGLAPRGLALDPNRALTQAFHRIWQVSQGLPQAAIHRILQTADGYLWLGTQAGLVRFDGVRFVSIDHAGDLSLKELWIRDLAEDHDGNLWIATDGAGLLRLKDGAARRYTTSDGLPSATIHEILLDPHNTLWTATPSGLARLKGAR